jgi:hypothetical protein
LTDAGQYPLLGGLLGKKYPSLNPNASLLSSTNYGDAISLREKNPSGFYDSPGGFGDPAKRLSAAYVMNKQTPALLGDERAGRLIQALYACVDARSA